MATNTPTHDLYSLLDEPWIPCQMLDGSLQALGLRSVFKQATGIQRIVGDTPLQTVTLYRLLLAISWRAQCTAGDLADASPVRWWVRHFTGAADHQPLAGYLQSVLDYLNSVAHRFNLLDPAHPFLQVPGLRKPDGSVSSADRLVPEAESTYFSTRAGAGRESLSLAEAARWLLVVNGYDYAGIKSGVEDDLRVKGGKSYPIGPGWAGQTGQIIIHGRNLAQSLLLNTPVKLIAESAQNGEDLASWESAELLPIPADTGELFPSGPVNALTWTSRRMRLQVEGDRVVGVLVTNGYKLANKNQFMDPLTGYRYSKNQSSKTQDVFMPQEHDEELPLWRGIQALLLRQGVGPAPGKGMQPNKPAATIEWLQEIGNDELIQPQPIRVELFGVSYGPQQSSIADVFSDIIPLNLAVLVDNDTVLANHIIAATLGTMEASTELGRFAGNLAVAGGGDYAVDADAKRTLLHALEAQFSQWLIDPQLLADISSHRLAWEQGVRRIVLAHARSLIDAVSPKALLGTLGDDGRLTSAGTAFNHLSARLDIHLPQAAAAFKEALAKRDSNTPVSTSHTGGVPA